MRRSPMILGIVGAILAGLLVSKSLTKTEFEGNSNADYFVQDGDRTSVATHPSVNTENDGGWPMKNSLEQEFNSAASESRVESVKIKTMESQAVSFGGIDFDFVVGSDEVEDNFSRLAEEFRHGRDERASEKREQFQQIFYQQDQLLSGEVSLDVLECGVQLCVAELRSTDSATLRAFMNDHNDWQGFESKTTIEVPTQQPGIIRLIFSHDPGVDGITLPSVGG